MGELGVKCSGWENIFPDQSCLVSAERKLELDIELELAALFSVVTVAH